MLLDWLRLWPEFIRLNLQKARHARRVRHAGASCPPPAPCQSGSDTGRANETHCEACLRLDRSTRYRHVCPALRVTSRGAFCTLDSAAIRPCWTRALVALVLPPLALAATAILGVWLFLRFGSGLAALPIGDVAWPPRWKNIAEHRRSHFRATALRALAAGDPSTTSVALFSAAHSGSGTPAENHTLARLATLGGYHSLADEIHVATIAAHPDRAAELAIAWHDDLLISARPRQLARLALAQLARADAPREFWLRAFFDSLRHRGVAAELLALSPPLELPHPGLRPALAARKALDQNDQPAAADQLLAFSGLLPGETARRFLVFSWLDAREPSHARAAALSRAHPAPAGEIPLLLYTVLRAEGANAAARDTLRPLFAEPALRSSVLAALMRDPDAELLREFATALPPEARTEPALLAGVWLDARLAAAPDLAAAAAADLGKLGHGVPAELESAPPSRETLAATAGLLPFDRELLRALRAAP